MRPFLPTFQERVRHFFYGMCIGASDLVPGVSGGTMALILGIYENLIASLKSFGTKEVLSLFYLDFKRFHRQVGWDYLLTLLSGMALSFILLAQFIQFLLQHEVYRVYLYALFFGMILSSIVFCLKRISKWQRRFWWGVAAGAAATLLATNIQFHEDLFDVTFAWEKAEGLNIANYDQEKKLLKGVGSDTLSLMWDQGKISGDTPVFNRALHQAGVVSEFVKPKRPPVVSLWLIGCGAMGISAMLLPGISGSYVLMILGVYPAAIGALADLVKGWTGMVWDRDATLILGNLAVGIVIGAVLFSRVIEWFLRKDHDMTMAVLIGFMGGALPVVWPFWNTIWVIDPLRLSKGLQLQILNPYIPSQWSFHALAAFLLCVGGFVLVYSLDKMANTFLIGSLKKS